MKMTNFLGALNLQSHQQDYSDAVVPMQQLGSRHENKKSGKKVTLTVTDIEIGQNATDLEPRFDEQTLAKEIEAELTASERNSPYHRM